MAWQAEILAFEPHPDNKRNIRARARFFNDATGEEILDSTWANDLTHERVVAWAKANVNVLETRDTNLATLQAKLGIVEFKQSTADEVDLAAFLVKAETFARLKTQAAHGIIEQNDATLATAQAELKAAWKPEFSGKTPLG